MWLSNIHDFIIKLCRQQAEVVIIQMFAIWGKANVLDIIRIALSTVLDSRVSGFIYTRWECLYTDHAMEQVVRRQLLSAEAWVRSQVSPRGICNGWSGIWTGYSPSPSASLISIIPALLNIHTHIWARQRPQFHTDSLIPSQQWKKGCL
jgi:hypothetical protein